MRELLQLARQIFLKTWGHVLSIATVVGALYIWPDIRDLPKTYGYKWEFPMWLDRETMALVLFGLAALWIIWIDIRPFVKQWWQKKRQPSHFIIGNNIYCEAYTIEEIDATLFQHIYYISVGNGREDGQKLDRVQARIHFAETPALCRIKDVKTDSIDLRHGECAHFEIGQLVAGEVFGLMRGKTKIKEKWEKVYKHSIPNGHLSFEINSANKSREYGLGNMKDTNSEWYIYVVISADNVKSATAKITIKMDNTKGSLSCERIN